MCQIKIVTGSSTFCCCFSVYLSSTQAVPTFCLFSDSHHWKFNIFLFYIICFFHRLFYVLFIQWLLIQDAQHICSLPSTTGCSTHGFCSVAIRSVTTVCLSVLLNFLSDQWLSSLGVQPFLVQFSDYERVSFIWYSDNHNRCWNFPLFGVLLSFNPS